ncbi:NTP transferase domain-containing protein [Candidatus Uhrbacteria bacterium]|nr:NTP transferase domain-containing protein [Candidatus Uhrbacteria bacterium]
MPVVILCGGKGTRMREETEYRPKPMVEVGGRPILWHIMKHYAHYGHREFILCLGYRGNDIKDYFLRHHLMANDFRLSVSDGRYHRPDNGDYDDDDFHITFADTGLESLTAERVLRVAKYIRTPRFMLTYGDGVSDLDILRLHAHHEERRQTHGVVATITGIHPKSKYGLVCCDDRCLVTSFKEKPRLNDYTNGGFMVLERDFIGQYCRPGKMIEEALIDASQDRKVSLYQHDGFWHSMDTVKDKEDLESLWNSDPKWCVWRKAKATVEPEKALVGENR